MTKSLAQQIRQDLEDGLGLDAKPAVETWLAADDAFNHWFLETTKGSVDDDTLMALLGGYGETQDVVEGAWRAYLDDRDLAPLEAALATSLAGLAKLRAR